MKAIPLFAVSTLLTCLSFPCVAQNLVPVVGKSGAPAASTDQLPTPAFRSQIDQPQPETEVIQQRYPDGKVQIRRVVAQDADGNYHNHGAWQLLNRRGQVLAEGEFDHGLREGTWQRWHPVETSGLFSGSPFTEFDGPFLSIATFQRGRLHGTWTVYDQSRKKVLEIPYQNGLRHGLVTWYWPNNQRMRQIPFQNGILDGELMEWDRESHVTRQATYQSGRERVTEQSWYGREQMKSENHFLAPELRVSGEDDWWNAQLAGYETDGPRTQQGPSRSWYRNGQLETQTSFDNGKQHGSFTSWYSNGQKQIEGYFEHGAKQGEWLWWHDNGMKAIQGTYQNNSPTSQWTWWTPEGSVTNQETFTSATSADELEEIK